MTDLDDFLATCDDVIDDWHGSFDSATWTADGSHEHVVQVRIDLGPLFGWAAAVAAAARGINTAEAIRTNGTRPGIEAQQSPYGPTRRSHR